MALSPAEMQEAIIRNLPAKTGKTLEEWIDIASSFNLEKNSAIIKQLKNEHGLGHVQAQTIVWRMNGKKPYVESKGYEEALFRTEANYQRYTSIRNYILGLNDEIKIKPCKTYIPFYRKKQFAILTEKKGRLLLGLNIPADLHPELDKAVRLGGSDRINKVIPIDDDGFAKIRKYILTAFENN